MYITSPHMRVCSAPVSVAQTDLFNYALGAAHICAAPRAWFHGLLAARTVDFFFIFPPAASLVTFLEATARVPSFPVSGSYIRVSQPPALPPLPEKKKEK